jgi:hypothetical protein
MVVHIRRFLLIILISTSCFTVAQSDPTYGNVVNKYSTGNVSEDGVNSSKAIKEKLNEIDQERIEHPEGWDEMLKEADVLVQKERLAKLKQDSIQNELEIQSKAVLLKQQRAITFKNQMLGLLFGLLSILVIFFIIRRIIRVTKKKYDGLSINRLLPTRRFNKLNQKEILVVSIVLGLIVSIISGSLFPKTKYLKLYKGQSVEVSETMSTFKLHEFNYMLCIVIFLVSVSLLYATWHFNNQKAKN